MPVLTLDRVGHQYGSPPRHVVALDDVSLRVESGELLAIMGPSGSGKSTLLHVAGGLEHPTSGRVVLSGHDLGSLGQAELSLVLRRRVGFVFQAINLLASLTAAENVSLPLELDGIRPALGLVLPWSAPGSCSPPSASMRSPTDCQARCRAASSSASPSPAR